jgi:bifunctional DNase/RNase
MLHGRTRQFWVTAGLWLMASIWLSGESMGERIALTVREEKDLLQVKVHKLIVDPASMRPVVFLADSREERALPIWIGPCEANALNMEIQGTQPPRPLTHDLMVRMMQKVNARVQRIIITHSKEGTYYATLVMDRGGSLEEIDARPSDSIVMALKFKAPIFVSKNLFGEMAVSLEEQEGIEERYGVTIQELTPLLAQSFSYKSTRGALVADVREGSLAEKDGLHRGDIVVEVGGIPVEDVMSLKGSLAKIKSPVTARVFRKGDFLSITIHPK